MIPSAPKFTELPKIHKKDIPIGPLVNFTTAPGFKTSKILYKINKVFYSSSKQPKHQKPGRFYKTVQKIKMKQGFKIASLDIVNMYTNIPIQEALKILEKNLIDTSILDKEKKS